MLHSTLHWCYLLWLKLKLDNGKVGEQSRPRWWLLEEEARQNSFQRQPTVLVQNCRWHCSGTVGTVSTVGAVGTVGTVLVVAGTKSN